jgi:predicted ribosome quality control (RQC) complex YloA/Tae2 family protein
LNEATLRRVTRDLVARLLAPARVAAAEATARRLSFLLEWPQAGVRRRLVIDVDPAHPTLHLAPAGREPAVASMGGFCGGIPGLFLSGVEEAGEPRLLRFRFLPPPRAAAAELRTLVAEWTGASGNLRLLDEEDIVLEAVCPGGPRPGDAWRPPRRRNGVRGAANAAGGAADAVDAAGAPNAPAAADTAGEAEPDALHAALARAHVAAMARAEAEERRRLCLRTLQAEVRRLLRLRRNLLEERVEPDYGPRLRRGAEAILSHLHRVKKGDTRFECPDWVREGEMLVVELDPSKTPAQNADDCFRRARRWERGEPHRRRRLEAIEQAVARLSALEVKVKDAEDPPGALAFDRRLSEALGIFRSARTPSVVTRPASGGGRSGGGRGDDAGAAGEAASAGRSPRRSSAGREDLGAVPDRPETTRERRDRKDGAGFHPRSFRTRDGWTVLVGRSNQENDYLTHRIAHPEDYWFHAHSVPGSHVVLRREGRKDNPSAKTIEEAAAIAAFFSKARHSSKAPVIYTLKKYVRKPRGARPGLAMCQREKTIMVLPKDPAEGREPEWMDE